MLTLILDPTGVCRNLHALHKSLCGRGSYIVRDQLIIATDSGASYKEVLETSYYPTYWDMKGVTVTSEGVYQAHVGNPDQHPLFSVSNDTEIVYFYEFEIIICRNLVDGSMWMTRID